MKKIPRKNHKKILDFFNKNNRMPTFEEVKKMYGYRSKSAVSYFLDHLIDDGVIGKDKNGRLFLKEKLGIPFYQTRIPAGFPSPAEEELVDTMSLDDYLINNREATFMLKVEGDSMIDACIADGDLIIVERRENFNDGDIVVAQVEDGYTVKYLKKEKGGKFFLRPANADYKDIYPTEDNKINIIALVVAVVRKLRI